MHAEKKGVLPGFFPPHTDTRHFFLFHAAPVTSVRRPLLDYTAFILINFPPKIVPGDSPVDGLALSSPVSYSW